jgi:alpha-N-arabinofuranosidase
VFYHLYNIILKVANKSGTPELVDIILKGQEKIDNTGHSTSMTGSPDAENSLTNPTNIVPSVSTFIAGKRFKYTFPAYSVTVLRIKVLK